MSVDEARAAYEAAERVLGKAVNALDLAERRLTAAAEVRDRAYHAYLDVAYPENKDRIDEGRRNGRDMNRAASLAYRLADEGRQILSEDGTDHASRLEAKRVGSIAFAVRFIAEKELFSKLTEGVEPAAEIVPSPCENSGLEIGLDVDTNVVVVWSVLPWLSVVARVRHRKKDGYVMDYTSGHVGFDPRDPGSFSFGPDSSREKAAVMIAKWLNAHPGADETLTRLSSP